MGNPQYIQDAVDGFENLYGEELTEQQRQNLVEALEYGGTSLGMDVDLATKVLIAWSDCTGCMKRVLDSAGDIKTILSNFAGGYEDLDEYLKNLYIEYLGIQDKALASLALKPLDIGKYRRDLERKGWLFVPRSDGTLTYVFSA